MNGDPDAPPVETPDAPAIDAAPSIDGAPDIDAPPVIDASPEVDAPVTLVDLDPQMGAPSGGNLVTFFGDQYDAATQAALAGTTLSNIAVTPPSSLAGTAPAGTGFASATVANAGSTANIPRAYHFGGWQPTGPSGGQVRDLVAAGASDVFAATAAGVFRSTDAGASWTVAATGLASGDIRALAVDPTDPAHVFAATAAGVFATTTAGASWSKSGDSPIDTRRIAIAPSLMLATTAREVHRSLDGGATWTRVLADLRVPSAIAIAPSDPSIAFVAVDDGLDEGIYKSTDAGATWTVSRTGIGNTFVTSVAVDPANAAVVYAVAQSQVFKSTNGGAAWSRVTSYALPGVPPRIVVARPGGKLYVGSSDAKMATSDDAGATWRDISTGIAAQITSDINCIAVRGSDVHIGVGPEGIFKSANAGASWAKSDAGMSTLSFSAIAASPVTAGRALAIGGNTVFRTTDHGVTWTPASTGLPTILTRPRTVAFHPTNANIAFVGMSTDGVYRSNDGGQTWTASSSGMEGVDVVAILVDPAKPTRMFAAAGQGTYRSLDSGQTWTQQLHVGPGSFTSITTAVVRRGNAILVANARLIRSADAGETWEAFGTGLPTSSLTELHADPLDPQVVYAIADARVFRSTDAGASWLPVTPAGTPVATMAIDPARSATIYVGASSGPAVLRSLTTLATLRVFDTGLPAGVTRALAIDRTSGTVYLGAESAGLFRLP